MLLDSSARHQKYIEDCEICCNPLEILAEFDNQELISFAALNIEQ